MGSCILHFLKIETPRTFAYVYLHEKHNGIKINMHKLIFNNASYISHGSLELA